MRKPRRSYTKVKILFWILVLLGGAWIAFIPPSSPPPPVGITIPVKVPEEPPVPPTPSSHTEQPPTASSPETHPSVPPPHPAAPRLALVIDDVGVDLKDSERAIRLPAPITLSFLPYGGRLREQTKEARAHGHELLLHMPMEPLGHEDPGPGALLVDLPMHDLQQRFETALASFTGFDGVNNHMGSKFTQFPEGMEMVVTELQARHLFFLDSRTSAQSIGLKIAAEKGLPSAGRDVFLDDDINADSITAQLHAAERVARHKGFAIAIGHPHPATLEVLERWIPDAEKQGFEFVPVHMLVKQSP